MDLKNYEYKTEFARKYVAQGREQGRVEGQAGAILRVLEARGLAVPDAVRDRILRCTDSALLERWIGRAAIAVSAADVIGDDEA
jgi:hypothetical protein